MGDGKTGKMDLDEEIRDGYTVPASMKRIWKVQMDLLQKLLEVCEKNGLRIWASSGTLLGAVRHRGYIPWDDDIDMVMMRDDYNKLVEVAPKEFSSPFFFQCAYTESVPYHRGHAQLRMDGTTAILKSDYQWDFHHGIFIDIFVFDALPDDEKSYGSFSSDIKETKHVLMRWFSSRRLSLNPMYYFRLMCEFVYRHTHDFMDCYRMYENTLSRYSVSQNKYVVKLGLTCDLDYIRQKRLDKRFYDETVFLPFENIQIPVPKEYDKVLTILYGDYMKPQSQPTYHGGYLAVDTEKSYEPYLLNLRKSL